jgi:hypothetical protein
MGARRDTWKRPVAHEHIHRRASEIALLFRFSHTIVAGGALPILTSEIIVGTSFTYSIF